MWAHPGKKLLFMGGEFAQGSEWNHDQSLDWHLLDVHWHSGVQQLVRELNRAYRELPALHELDCEADGFEWIEANDAEHSIYAFVRKSRNGKRPVLVVSNFTPVLQGGCRIGVTGPGFYQERINTDADIYGGSNAGNVGGVEAEQVESHGREWSVRLTIPGLSTLILEHQD
jgi:1,4-alpha-glucan branching enzyme